MVGKNEEEEGVRKGKGDEFMLEKFLAIKMLVWSWVHVIMADLVVLFLEGGGGDERSP